jgi:DNA/RNA endonuclease YhcR with UshA esterase domain
MKTRLIIFLALFFTLTLAANSQDTISSKEAKDFIGQVKIVKGPVASVFVSNKSTVLINFDEVHPNSTFVAVIKAGTSGISYSDIKKGTILTISGLIEDYKGKPEIILNEQSQIIKIENP